MTRRAARFPPGLNTVGGATVVTTATIVTFRIPQTHLFPVDAGWQRYLRRKTIRAAIVNYGHLGGGNVSGKQIAPLLLHSYR